MTWADSMAIKPSGSTAERQRTRFHLPSPGSTSTMTAPARNSAKTSVTKSSPGPYQQREPCARLHAPVDEPASEARGVGV